MQEHWSEQELAAVGGVLQWDGDRVLAQVLGAKFGSCQVSPMLLSAKWSSADIPVQRPDGGDTPLGLVYMAALLVRHGFVGLADLLPFVRRLIFTPGLCSFHSLMPRLAFTQ